MIDLGHNLGMKVVVEGVENKKMVTLLASYGCDYIQGYYFSKVKVKELCRDFRISLIYKTGEGGIIIPNLHVTPNSHGKVRIGVYLC